MKKNIKIIILSIVLIILLSICIIINLLNNNKADMIIYSNIYTGVMGDSIKESIAIKNDKIIYVGDKTGAKKYEGKNTKVATYNDGFVFSGITDTHTHVTPYFGTNEYQIDVTNASSYEEYVKIIKDYIKDNPDKEMIIGRGWDKLKLPNNNPTKEMLDKLSSDKPIYLKSSDGHSCWVNSKMLELIGVNKDTPNPVGGEIVKDKNGNPTGYLKDTAMDVLAKPYVIPLTVEEFKSSILKAQEYYASLGYSSYIEVLVEPDEANYNLYKAYEELDRENKLFLRVQAAWNIANNEDTMDSVKKVIKYKNESKGGMFELTDIKIFMDGVVETGTAYLSEAYNNNSSNYGADRWPGKEGFNKLVDVIELANRNGLVAHFHAIGDAAVTKTLDAIEESRKRFIDPKLHNVITHFELVDKNDFSRLKDLDVIVSADLSWGCKTYPAYENVELPFLGEKRALSAYPYKTALDSGAVLSSSTDYPAGALAWPIASFLVGVNRSYTKDGLTLRNEKEKLTVDEAIRAMTYSGAYQMRQEDIRGTLEVDKNADFIIVDTNILENSTVDSINADIVANVVNGKVVYGTIKNK